MSSNAKMDMFNNLLNQVKQDAITQFSKSHTDTESQNTAAEPDFVPFTDTVQHYKNRINNAKESIWDILGLKDMFKDVFTNYSAYEDVMPRVFKAFSQKVDGFYNISEDTLISCSSADGFNALFFRVGTQLYVSPFAFLQISLQQKNFYLNFLKQTSFYEVLFYSLNSDDNSNASVSVTTVACCELKGLSDYSKITFDDVILIGQVELSNADFFLTAATTCSSDVIVQTTNQKALEDFLSDAVFTITNVPASRDSYVNSSFFIKDTLMFMAAQNYGYKSVVEKAWADFDEHAIGIEYIIFTLSELVNKYCLAYAPTFLTNYFNSNGGNVSKIETLNPSDPFYVNLVSKDFFHCPLLAGDILEPYFHEAFSYMLEAVPLDVPVSEGAESNESVEPEQSEVMSFMRKSAQSFSIEKMQRMQELIKQAKANTEAESEPVPESEPVKPTPKPVKPVPISKPIPKPVKPTPVPAPAPAPAPAPVPIPLKKPQGMPIDHMDDYVQNNVVEEPDVSGNIPDELLQKFLDSSQAPADNVNFLCDLTTEFFIPLVKEHYGSLNFINHYKICEDFVIELNKKPFRPKIKDSSLIEQLPINLREYITKGLWGGIIDTGTFLAQTPNIARIIISDEDFADDTIRYTIGLNRDSLWTDLFEPSKSGQMLFPKLRSIKIGATMYTIESYLKSKREAFKEVMEETVEGEVVTNTAVLNRVNSKLAQKHQEAHKEESLFKSLGRWAGNMLFPQDCGSGPPLVKAISPYARGLVKGGAFVLGGKALLTASMAFGGWGLLFGGVAAYNIYKNVKNQNSATSAGFSSGATALPDSDG